MLGATSLINNYSNVFGVQQGQSLGQLVQTLTTATQQGQSEDSVSFSSSAMMLQQLLNSEMQGNDEDTDLGGIDLMSLAQLKQRGDMLANMLQLKMKNFESHLVSNVQGAGLPMQDMHLKNGDDGLSLLGEMPNKETLQNALGGLQGEFLDMSRLAEVLNMLQQIGPDDMVSALSASAAHYAQQSSVKRPESDFILHVLQSGTSFTFE